jgi:transposase InsO family protein
VRSWKSSKAPPKKRGRKKIRATPSQKLAVKNEWEKQGCPGSLPIIKTLPFISVRLIREIIAELKKEKRQRYQEIKLKNRTTVTVHNAGVMLVMDGATVKSEGGDFIVHRDRGSKSVNAQKCGTKACSSQDTLAVLNELKQNEKLPLVLGTDNGSPFCANTVETFLELHEVIHLKSLPHVPQQNGSAENAVGDFKLQIKDGKTYEEACATLNMNRPRQTLGWLTSAQAEQINFLSVTPDLRSKFYKAARTAIDAAMLGTETAYEKRKAEREAIFNTLENFSFITRTRGHRPYLVKAEEIT